MSRNVFYEWPSQGSVQTITIGKEGMDLYEYAVLLIPRDNENNIIKDECEVLTPPNWMLASSREVVSRTAIKNLSGTPNLEHVEVQVRPFEGE